MTERSKKAWIRRVSPAIAAIGGVTLALFLRSLVEPRSLVEEHRDAEVPDLPADWEGRLIAFLCDFHVGMRGGSDEALVRAVRRVIEVRPAAVLLAGDFVHDSRQSLGRLLELLRPLVQEGIPAYGVLGNHDYAMPTKKASADRELAAEVAQALSAAGIRILRNESVRLGLADSPEPLYLVGIGAHTPREDDPERALQEVPAGAARVVMMHHPASYEDCPPNSAPFAVAGHTHGGQVRLPFAPLVRYLTEQKELRTAVAGWLANAPDGYGSNGNRLYVSRGIGCSVLPMRLFCIPELTIFTLRRPD